MDVADAAGLVGGWLAGWLALVVVKNKYYVCFRDKSNENPERE